MEKNNKYVTWQTWPIRHAIGGDQSPNWPTKQMGPCLLPKSICVNDATPDSIFDTEHSPTSPSLVFIVLYFYIRHYSF